MSPAGERDGARWRPELLAAVLGGLLLFAVSLVPYLVAQANAPAGRTFNGFFFIADDAATYISKMREGADGAWAWRDPYISQPLPHPVALFLFYVLWGKVAGLLHVSMYVGYHLARLSGAIALVGAARLLARTCLPPGRPRRVAVVLALGGSGLGWFLQLAAAFSGSHVLAGQRLEALELHLPELSGFYSITAIPHFAWAAALMAFALVALMHITDGLEPARWLAVAVASMLALCLIHPQMLFVLGPLAITHLVAGRRGAHALALVAAPFLVCLPVLLYFLRILTSDEVVAAWSREWRHQAPDPLGLVFGLGVPLAFAVVTMVRWRRAGPGLRLMTAWLLLVFLVLYLPNPVNIQRRLMDGIYLPVAMLAAAGLEHFIAWRAGRPRGWFRAPGPLALGAVGVSMVMSVLVWGTAMTAALAREPIIYTDSAAMAAMEWLSGQRGAGLAPAVLSHPSTGLFIPARSGLRVYVGHYSETIDYQRKARVAFEAFRAGPYAVAALARDQHTDLIFVGPLEQAVAGTAVIDEIPGAVRVYDRGGVRIYRLR
ncbi:MAG: hypothetical protein ABR573_00340 [Candidatus Dormibacteria bacterium]